MLSYGYYFLFIVYFSLFSSDPCG